jgi:hypothetical protein
MNIIALQAITRKLHEIFNKRKDELSKAGYDYDIDSDEIVSARLSLVAFGCLNIFYTRNKDVLKNAREINSFLENSEFYIAKDSSKPRLLFGFSFGADSDVYASEKMADLIASPKKSDINFTKGDLYVLEELGNFVANAAVRYREIGEYLFAEVCYDIDRAVSGKDEYTFNFRNLEDIDILSEKLGGDHILLKLTPQKFNNLEFLSPNYFKTIFDHRKDDSLELEF